jgi:hypothetical protein
MIALALLLAQPVDHIGRIYTYVRSGRDGSEAEIVRVYRADRTHIEVSKMRERCTNAAPRVRHWAAAARRRAALHSHGRCRAWR